MSPTPSNTHTNLSSSTLAPSSSIESITSSPSSPAAEIGASLTTFPTPAFCIHRPTVKKNCVAMLQRAKHLGVRLRPHVKTHKSREIGRFQLGIGLREDSVSDCEAVLCNGIVVSTLQEASFFASSPCGHFKDILYAVPLCPSKIKRVLALHRHHIPGLQVLVDNQSTLKQLIREAKAQRDHQEKYQPSPGRGGGFLSLGVFIKIDCGYGRAGVDPDTLEAEIIADAIDAGSPWPVRFAGIYSHSGHSYHAQGSKADIVKIALQEVEGSKADIVKIALQEVEVMSKVYHRMTGKGLKPPIVSIGATPSCSILPTTSGSSSSIAPGEVGSNSTAAATNNEGIPPPSTTTPANEVPEEERPTSSEKEAAAAAAAAAASTSTATTDTTPATVIPVGGEGEEGEGSFDEETRLLSLLKDKTIPWELHPGNYCLYDIMQEKIGSCLYTSIACSVLTHVISHHPTKGRWLIDAGGMALSKDRCSGDSEGEVWGRLQGHEGLRITSVSQEVSVVEPSTTASSATVLSPSSPSRPPPTPAPSSLPSPPITRSSSSSEVLQQLFPSPFPSLPLLHSSSYQPFPHRQHHQSSPSRSSRRKKQIKVGDILHILPVHSCMTAGLHQEFLVWEEREVDTSSSSSSSSSSNGRKKMQQIVVDKYVPAKFW